LVAYYSTSPALVNGSYIFIDTNLEYPAGPSYLSDGTDWYQLSAYGEILNTNLCT
jgi:hypothetical protein